MERDGIAMVKFLKWLKEAVPAGNESELSVDRKLYELRAEQANFKGISFDTIADIKNMQLSFITKQLPKQIFL